MPSRRLASLRPYGLLVAAAFSVSACAPDEQPVVLDQAIASLGQPIEGGYVDELDTHVVGILYDNGYWQAGCTGSLIGSNVVLTAQHCVAEVLNEVGGGVQCGVTTFGQPYPVGDFYVTTRTEFSYNLNNYHRVMEIGIPPGGADFCGRDLAIMILDAPIDPSESPTLTPRVDVSVERGEIYSAVGFGQTYDSESAPSGTRHRRDGLVVQCVGEECPSYAVTQSEWVGETGICSGDSGGPALDSFGRVSGVTSRGAAYCDTPVYGHPYNWAQWIRDWAAHGAAILGETPAPWITGWPTDPAFSQPIGPACELPEQCGSGICLDGYCTRLCSEAAPCPEGYECTADSFICRAIPAAPPSSKKSSSEDEGGCAVSGRRLVDPTQPTPWLLVAAALGAAVVRRRRRGPDA